MRTGNGRSPQGQLKASTEQRRSGLKLRVWRVCAEIIILIESALRNETLKAIRSV